MEHPPSRSQNPPGARTPDEVGRLRPMSTDNSEGKSPHDTEETTAQPSTAADDSPDWEAVGRTLARDRLEAVAFDLREAFFTAAHDDLDAEDLRDLFDELEAAAVVVGEIAEHTPGAVNEADPYRNLSREETAKAIGYADAEAATGGNGE